ncbi:hypothetical protein FHX77_000945 [Bifidobacterium commune]|uniref:Uncharacterized protein n=1 Tax=Bifidobacterium commune TaxID=1505727 RepID=A0A1C4H549_9BIFI|nr:hypothetical protein [Bifidobacterium commune]SCC80005.1 hypothetical protein GA0061077_0925 [Bifidobacterium commune]
MTLSLAHFMKKHKTRIITICIKNENKISNLLNIGDSTNSKPCNHAVRTRNGMLIFRQRFGNPTDRPFIKLLTHHHQKRKQLTPTQVTATLSRMGLKSATFPEDRNMRYYPARNLATVLNEIHYIQNRDSRNCMVKTCSAAHQKSDVYTPWWKYIKQRRYMHGFKDEI